VWTPYNRDEIDEMKNQSRMNYINKFFSNDNKRQRTEESFHVTKEVEIGQIEEFESSV
jgi:hypothetical protein